MIVDIIAILIIVILSFILCMNDNNYRCQFSHIIIGLSVIVFYKLAKYFNLNQNIKNNKTNTKENFTTDLTSSINNFITGVNLNDDIISNEQAKKLSNTELSAYNDRLTELINTMRTLQVAQSLANPDISSSPDTIQKLDLESQQQYQMFQIDYLNKQLQNAKEIINARTVANTSTNYKPIKVYSSCIVSNADGSTTMDTPVRNNQSTAANPFQNPLLFNPTTLTSTSQNPGTNPGFNPSYNPATSQQQSTDSTNRFLNLSPKTGIFNNILDNLAKGNVNINV